MVSDLPDYTRYISFNADLPTPSVDVEGPVVYYAAPTDLADGDRAPALADIKRRVYVRIMGVDAASGKLPVSIGDTVNVALPDAPALSNSLQVIARPRGDLRGAGSVTTTASFATVVSRTVTNGKRLHLASITVSCDQDVEFQVRWDGTVIFGPHILASKLPWPHWFPWNWGAMDGNGVKAFDVQARYPSGGAAGTCTVDWTGEEV